MATELEYEKLGVPWLAALCYKLEDREIVLNMELEDLFTAEHVQQLVRDKMKTASQKMEILDKYNVEEGKILHVISNKVQEQVRLLEELEKFLQAAETAGERKKKKAEVEVETTGLPLSHVKSRIGETTALMKRILQHIDEIERKKSAIEKDFLDAYKQRIRKIAYLPGIGSPEFKSLERQHKDAIQLLHLERALQTDLIELMGLIKRIRGDKGTRGEAHSWAIIMGSEFPSSTSDENRIKERITEDLAIFVEIHAKNLAEVIYNYFRITKQEEDAEKILEELTKHKNVRGWLESHRTTKWKRVRKANANQLQSLFRKEQELFSRLKSFLNDAIRYLEGERGILSNLEELAKSTRSPIQITQTPTSDADTTIGADSPKTSRTTPQDLELRTTREADSARQEVLNEFDRLLGEE